MKEKTTDYVRIRLEVRGFDPDRLSAVLFREGALGIEELDESIWFVYFAPDFSSMEFSHLQDSLLHLNPGFRPEQAVSTRLRKTDWNAEWKKHFQPIKTGSQVWIVPPWETSPAGPREISIVIDPQMAFGTGSHETTQLMIESMEKYLRPGDSVLDAGCGSGILSLLAAKMGAGTVTGFDIEAEAVENAVHNAGLNKIDGLEFLQGDEKAVAGRQFDLVLANINRNVLLDMLPALDTLVKPEGTIILSGLLDTDESMIREQRPGPWRPEERFRKNEWIALVFTREHA